MNVYCTVQYYLVCNVQKIFHQSPAQVVTYVMNALRREIRDAAREKTEELERVAKEPFACIAAPPDGYCAYHCILGSLTFSDWVQIQRHSNGVAINNRIAKMESDSVKSFREFALQETPDDCPVIAEQALSALATTTVDIGELSWLGVSLDLAIRCVIDDEA